MWKGIVLFACFVCYISCQDVTVSLSVDKVDPFVVHFDVYNPNGVNLVLSKWGTPFEGALSDMFNVYDASGNELQYNGLLMRRNGEPLTSQTLYLPSKTSSSVSFDLRHQYGFNVEGIHYIHLDLPMYSNISTTPESVLLVSTTIPSTDVPTVPAYELASKEHGLGAFINCDNSNKNAVIAGYQGSVGEVSNSQQCLAGTRSCSGVASTWFGSTSNAYAHDKNIFASISSYLSKHVSTQTYNVYCYPNGCGNNVYAYVYPSDSSMIVYLCNLYFTLPAERVNTVIHELSHFNSLGQTQDYAYGKTACKNLATSSPSKAQSNADNVCYFAEYA